MACSVIVSALCHNIRKAVFQIKKDNYNNRRNRKYQLTFNNPDKHKKTSHQSIKETLKQWENLIYWCMADEIAKTLHTHLFIQFKNPIYFSSIKKAFPTAHIEEAQGTAKENKLYIIKEGKWAETEKGTTNLKDTYEEWGTIPEQGQGKRNDLMNLYQMIKDGYSNVEILENNPDNILNLQHIDKARLEILSNQYKSERRLNLVVTYVSGKTGYGKSRHILDSHGDANVYRVTDYKHAFDTYNGEDVIVFEEYRSDLPIGNMLNYLDVYPLQLPARYNNRQACYNFVYIVSNWKLEDQYFNIKNEQPETYQAWLRRIHKVRVYTAPNTWNEYQPHDYLYGFHPVNDMETPF
ncbi:hypothetical protein Ana3638_04910 [Anaerocolumna sedimenticola]|uniref:CRESS-DNA virus Rep endonuclease domain-containing protein n=1 Tax=Anaerocolumna sedimenticola TaxID=2696063 RepID=A0A6P1TTM4_9FIRM|nr:hypothetical protein [Anaerocolumna sedimenticola]QHQ63642.1 hypothetical protein Ana3638_04910 [Anaerocolumna sedimenticola]